MTVVSCMVTRPFPLRPARLEGISAFYLPVPQDTTNSYTFIISNKTLKILLVFNYIK